MLFDDSSNNIYKIRWLLRAIFNIIKEAPFREASTLAQRPRQGGTP